MAENRVENNLQLLRVNHSLKMTEAFETMFLDESLCDISICCGGEVVKAHRVILAASSSYFKQILSGINCQTQYPIIFVSGIQMPDLSAMLEFMYRGEVTIPQTQLPSLIKSAEILGVSGLCQLDPNAQNISETNDKSRTSSPTDSTGGTTRRNRKRKKVFQKSDNETIGSDSETQTKKPEENCDESEDLESSEVKPPTEKLVKSKLRSWTQQIALKANHKEGEESQQMSESESKCQQSVEESEKSQVVTETTVSPKKNTLKENWRHSRARRPPLKYSEYTTLPKGILDVKPITDKKNESQKEMGVETDETASSTTVVVRPPSPRLTRGRSRVHSNDDPKVINVKEEEPEVMATASTSSDNLNSSLTPNTRSRRQTHSPSEGKIKDNESISQTSDKPSIKSEDESSQGSSQTSQTRNKTPVKIQNSIPSSSSLFKWRPKDPQLTTTKFTEKVRPNSDPNEELNYQYEAIEEDGPPVYRCSYCMHCFRSKQNIIDHIRSVHIKSEQRYDCQLCHKKFKWKTSLNNHFNQVHPDSRPTPLRFFDKSRKSLSEKE